MAAVAARLSHLVVARRGRRARLRGHDQARFVGDETGACVALEAVRVELRRAASSSQSPGSEFEIPCDLVLLAMGFVGPVQRGAPRAARRRARRARQRRDDATGRTSVDGVFAAGDMARGQSLVVWAIAEGRKVAAAVDAWLGSGQ